MNLVEIKHPHTAVTHSTLFWPASYADNHSITQCCSCARYANASMKQHLRLLRDEMRDEMRGEMRGEIDRKSVV